MPALRRRSALAAAALLPFVVACARSEPPGGDAVPGVGGPSPARTSYGDDPSQWVDRYAPVGPSRGTVVVIHGGFWRAQYGADLGAPLASDLAAKGWTALNVEYRRVGSGGGFPTTFDDIHAAINLAESAAGATGPVVTLGHSAGGHLATWAAARQRFDRWSGGVRVSHVLSQAGVLDLTTAAEEGLGGGAIEAFMGARPDDATYDLADPQRQVPLDVPVWCLHAPDDTSVPISQSRNYVQAATEAGGRAEFVEVAGGHFDLIDTGSSAWHEVLGILDTISPAS